MVAGVEVPWWVGLGRYAPEMRRQRAHNSREVQRGGRAIKFISGTGRVVTRLYVPKTRIYGDAFFPPNRTPPNPFFVQLCPEMGWPFWSANAPRGAR